MSPTLQDAGALRDEIRATYRDVARDPDGDFHFETGRPLAERLGYPAEWLDAVGPERLARFAGVGHFLDLAGIEPRETVLDLGSGSGTDACIAGAVPLARCLQAIEASGLRTQTVRTNTGYHFHSPHAQATAERYGVTSVSVLAVKP